MKAVLRVCNMNTIQDVNRIRNAISNNEGVIACQISKEKGEIDVIYDNYFVNADMLIDSLEGMGYTVI